MTKLRVATFQVPILYIRLDSKTKSVLYGKAGHCGKERVQEEYLLASLGIKDGFWDDVRLLGQRNDDGVMFSSLIVFIVFQKCMVSL